MKAIVLAAGRGTRLGHLTDAVPKPLIAVGGAPLIEHVLRGVAAAGIDEVAVVSGYRGEQLRAFAGDGSRFGVRITWFEQAQPDGTACALLLGRAFLGEEPFLFAWSDVLVQPANYVAAVEAAGGFDGALCVNRVDDPWAGAAVYVDDDCIVTRLVEKPARGTSATSWNNAGIGVLPSSIWAEVEALLRTERQEHDLPSAVSTLIERGARLKAVPISGPWFDIGTPESLAAARAAYERA